MDLGIAGKTALVTGGSRGLGRAICIALAAEGASVGVDYRGDPAKAEETTREIERLGKGRAAKIKGDLSREADIIGMYDRAEAVFGSPVEILVNNAAICPHGRVDETSLELWDEIIKVNLTGTFLACREMVRRSAGRKGTGRIVNVASIAAFIGSTSGQAAYDASKGGIVSLGLSLARETSGMGITVNTLVPGLMMTDMAERKYRADMEKYLSRIPLGRFPELEEVAAAVVFLCSRQAAYITGSTLNVSGGLLMR